MEDRFSRPMRGELRLRVEDQAGNILAESVGHNLIVAGGYEAAAEALAGVTGAAIARVAVGSSDTEPVEDNTAITDAVSVRIKNITYPASGTVRFEFLFDYKTANGMTIREFGLFTADGRLFSRKTCEPIVKTESVIIAGQWDIIM